MRFQMRDEHLDTDLNIVPIIDCFVMLICFMLFTAAFTQLVYLEAKLTSNTAQAADKSRNELDQFRLLITMNEKGYALTTSGSLAGGKRAVNINGFDYKALHQSIIDLKTQFPGRFSADIEVKGKTGAVNYDKIINTIDSVRHLTEEEYGQLRIVQKKLKSIDLSKTESEQTITPAVQNLANKELADATAQNTDLKVLFPDIALVGVE